MPHLGQMHLRMGIVRESEVTMRGRFDVGDETIAYALLRLVLGMNLMMHGVSRMLMGPGEFAGKLVTQFANTRLPEWMVWSFGVVLPGIEGLLGFCC
jgi:thiosulfate dehydrogenase (quinone) large subunit